MDAGALWPNDGPQLTAQAYRENLARDPLNAIDLYQLAMVTRSQSRNLQGLRLSEKVTRRFAPTQLQLLMQAAVLADRQGILRQADHILSVDGALADPVAAVVVTGISDPELRLGLASYAGRPWFANVLASATEKGQLEDVVQLIGALPKFYKMPTELLVRLQDRLVFGGRSDTAKSIALTHGRVPLRAFQEFGISAETTNPAGRPLTWKLPDIGGDIDAELTDRGVAYSFEPGSNGFLLQRTTDFAPGKYRLSFTAAAEQRSEISATWHLICRAPQGVHSRIQKFAVPGLDGIQKFAIVLTIPSNCPLQRWELKVWTPDGQQRMAWKLSDMSLERVQP